MDLAYNLADEYDYENAKMPETEDFGHRFQTQSWTFRTTSTGGY